MKGKLLPLHRADDAADLSDEALVAACAVGDSTALGLLFDRYHGQLHGFLGRLAGADAADLDDLVQATFLEVRRSAGQFGGKSKVRTWIFGVAVNVVRHHVRGEARRRATVVRYAEYPMDVKPLPDARTERRELLALLEQALAALPHDLRAAYIVCDVEELPGREAAAVLGVREGTLGRRLHEARARLRAALAPRAP